MEFNSYKDLVATPEAHLEFLRVIDSHLVEGKESGHLYKSLNATIKVGGEPFSQAKHLTAMESNSDDWELESTSDAVKVEIVALSEKIKAADSGYDVPHFTIGYEWMIREMKERGVKVEAGLDFSEKPVRESGVDYDSRMAP